MSGAREALEAATQQKVAALVGLSDAQAAQVSSSQAFRKTAAAAAAETGDEAALFCNLLIASDMHAIALLALGSRPT